MANNETTNIIYLIKDGDRELRDEDGSLLSFPTLVGAMAFRDALKHANAKYTVTKRIIIGPTDAS